MWGEKEKEEGGSGLIPVHQVGEGVEGWRVEGVACRQGFRQRPSGTECHSNSV